MFLTNSRYYGLPTATVPLATGHDATVVRLRKLSAVDGEPYVVRGDDRLDVLAHRRYGEATWFWHVADANTELEASHLVAVAGRLIRMPER